MTKNFIASLIPAKATNVELEIWENRHPVILTCANKAEALEVAALYGYDVEVRGFFAPVVRSHR